MSAEYVERACDCNDGFWCEPCRKFILHSNEEGRVFKHHFNRVLEQWGLAQRNFSGVESSGAFASFRICARRKR